MLLVCPATMIPEPLGSLVKIRGLMLSIYDYLAIAMYFGLIFAAGVMLRRQSTNTSDYFRAGGGIPWWMTGAALFMNFSAWTFTGAAGEVYKTGTFVLALYYSNVIGYATVWMWTCRRFRRLRVITWMEAVEARFGRGTQQFYTWVKIPILWLLGGVALYAVAVFMSSVFDVNLTATLVVCGVLVTLVSFFGGAWAVAANDFLQMFLVMAIALVAAALALHQPQVGGISGLLHRVPRSYFDWTANTPGSVIGGWIVAMVLITIFQFNSVENSPKFLMLDNDRQARRMTLIPIIGLLIGPLIWIIPSMTAILTHQNLHREFPLLEHPSEAAYVSVCLATMPRGMIGLLVSAIFAATITSLDAVLNQGVGVVVRNFYLPVVNPKAGEQQLLRISKVITLAFGAIIITIGVLLGQGTIPGLFSLTNQLAASLLMPMTVPLALCLIYLRTPTWSGWSTAAVGLVVSGLVKLEFPHILPMLLPGGHTHISATERTDALFFTTTFAVVGIGTAWFLMTGLFYRHSSVEHRARIETMRRNLNTPVHEASTGTATKNQSLYKVLGVLGTMYGVAICLLALIPNGVSGRISFLFCGAVMLLIGLIMLHKSRSSHTPAPEPKPDAAADSLLQES
jgi:Na+/proline symporter